MKSLLHIVGLSALTLLANSVVMAAPVVHTPSFPTATEKKAPVQANAGTECQSKAETAA